MGTGSLKCETETIYVYEDFQKEKEKFGFSKQPYNSKLYHNSKKSNQ